jgi:hypothetical protein
MHSWKKNIVSWRCGKELYLLVPFTWLLPTAQKMADEHNGPVYAGGPTVKLMGLDNVRTPDYCDFDVLK